MKVKNIDAILNENKQIELLKEQIFDKMNDYTKGVGVSKLKESLDEGMKWLLNEIKKIQTFFTYIIDNALVAGTPMMNINGGARDRYHELVLYALKYGKIRSLEDDTRSIYGDKYQWYHTELELGDGTNNRSGYGLTIDCSLVIGVPGKAGFFIRVTPGINVFTYSDGYNGNDCHAYVGKHHKHNLSGEYKIKNSLLPIPGELVTHSIYELAKRIHIDYFNNAFKERYKEYFRNDN